MEAGSGDGAVPHRAAALKRLMGFAGQPDKKAAEAWNKFIVTVMYAQACSGKMKAPKRR